MASKELQAVRNELKAMGYSNRKIGTQESFGGTCSVIWVSIKDEAIEVKEIEKVLAKFEDNSTFCEQSLDYSRGGETMIRVGRNIL